MSAITRGVGALLLLASAVVLPAAVHASGISPSAGDVQARQGDAARHVITVVNNEEDKISYSVRPIGVELGKVTTDVSFYELPDSLASMVTVGNSRFDLDPGEEKEVEIVLAPQDDAESQAFVLGVQVVEEASGSSDVQVGGGFVSLVFVTIGEDVEEGYEFLDFSASREFATELPISFALTLRNSGERIVQPQGSVDIVSIFGKTVDSFDINPADKRVSAGQTRTFVTVWDGRPGVLGAGIYRVRLRVAPWVHGEEFMQELTVVYAPKRTVLLLSAFFILFILISRYSSVLRRRL